MVFLHGSSLQKSKHKLKRKIVALICFFSSDLPDATLSILPLHPRAVLLLAHSTSGKLTAGWFLLPPSPGRHRWVEYGSKDRYNASQVPSEWHGWLHHVTDHTGDELLMLKPKRYGVEHKQNFSGEGDEYIYHSKGHALNPGQRDWTRYQPWQPSKT